jgi:uncharacterized protein
MKPRVTVLTLGVDNLQGSPTFYRDGLELSTQGIIGLEFEHGAVAFFELQSGMKLAIFARADLAHDSGLSQTLPSATECSTGHNVRSEAEVDEVMRQAERAGAKIVKTAQKTLWGGYAGYFADPDGHLWEVAFNPEFIPGD